jgi:probable rRNA maturation factor
MPNQLRIEIAALAGKTHTRFVKRHMEQAAAYLKSPLTELSIVFVGDRRMIALHDQFMNLPTTTDVLTFPIDEDARGRPLSGEVYVCIPEAKRQARQRGTAEAHEVLLYSLHGLLHLCGFDDRTDAQYRRMHRMEDHILTQLGIGKVFATKRPTNPGR